MPHKGSHTRKILVSAAALVALAAVATACDIPEDEPGTKADRVAAQAKHDKSDKAGNEEPSKPEMTAAQENAVGSAKDYLDYSAFSRSGLIGQLKFEGYSVKDATFAVDTIKPNWNNQAALSAQDYLDNGSFSRSGLIGQLKFEGYTPAQATYGVNQSGL